MQIIDYDRAVIDCEVREIFASNNMKVDSRIMRIYILFFEYKPITFNSFQAPMRAEIVTYFENEIVKMWLIVKLSTVMIS